MEPARHAFTAGHFDVIVDVLGGVIVDDHGLGSRWCPSAARGSLVA
jgi:hypothetical protein